LNVEDYDLRTPQDVHLANLAVLSDYFDVVRVKAAAHAACKVYLDRTRMRSVHAKLTAGLDHLFQIVVIH
jgi:hypothetical protein